MTITLSQLVKRHFAPEHAGTLSRALQQTQTPVGRIALHSLRTKEQIELIFEQKGNGGANHAPVAHIGPDVPLDELAIAWRDLEEEQGLLPGSEFKAITQPRVKSGKYAIFGVQDQKSISLFIIDKKREAEIAGINGLVQIPEFETYRLFSDFRDDTDLITGLRSRTYLDRLVSRHYLAGAQANFDLIVADLDHFKSLNEKYGYAAGDLGLKIMGQELKLALGTEGTASRRHYGDETASIAFKDLFLKTPGGAEAWAHQVNERLKARSRELPGEFTLRLTFGVYSLDEQTTYKEALLRADRALVYAKKSSAESKENRRVIQVWHPGLPTHEDMQSGRHLRYQDPELIQFGTAANRSFPTGIKPDQADGAREILDDIIHKSQPVREAANQDVLAELAHHLLTAQPSAMKNFSTNRVWQAVYTTRKNLGLLTAEEKTLEDTPARIAPYLAERLNLKFLLEEDTHKEEYNRTLESYINCRYDDSIKTITASTDSQHQSRFIISGRDKPTTGELNSIGHILNLLATGHQFEDHCGLITLYRDTAPDKKTILHFDNERFDVSPVIAQLAEKNARITNHLGLEGVTITPTAIPDDNPHYDFAAKSLAALEPLLWTADDQEHAGRTNNGHIKLFTVAPGILGAQIPNAAQLLSERIMLDPHYAARIYKEPELTTPWTDASTSTRVMRREISPARAIELIAEHYKADGVTTRGQLPIFHAPEAAMFKLVADLYIARDIYLNRRNGEYTITDLRVPELEIERPQFDEIVTHYARTFNALLQGTEGKLVYQIDRALPRLAHTPSFVGMRQLAVPVSARYGELFCR